jgi:hypothetical protein
MKRIEVPVSLTEIWETRETAFEEMLKIVVDIDQEIIAVDAEMHADLEQLLLQEGSDKQYLWGANVFPLREPFEKLEYTSFINIRPAMGNRSMDVLDPLIRARIDSIVTKLFV